MECRDDEIEYRGAPLATLPGDYFHILSREEIDLNGLGCDVMLLIGTEPTYCRECQVIERTQLEAIAVRKHYIISRNQM